ncbi:thiamine-phosphate kinase [Aurantiacibacter sp. MUD11]|uniref:thiamine-phosphate kinase n=1 Tax=Aurantiacibacter sp. MUD11 TaxID=3003265 RepID=UPI0022AAF08E|nr:thiamine-phosphate kinase [Aurantiacibacter sp. MUD11]WAT18837.1 thiamine-phosphate kinase [Aurantiacibacter sp. MUD11]
MRGEAEFISALRQLPLHPGARNLEDDTAVLEIGGETLVITHDVMVEGVHFRPDQDLFDVGWKIVAVNISDLAAKGAKPIGLLLGYTLGRDDQRFVAGMHAAMEAFDVALLGGDTVSSPSARSFGITAIGRAVHVPVPSRSGAGIGDRLWVTGTLGAAMVGHDAMPDGDAETTLPYRQPRALVAEGQQLAPQVTAMMDISDGLLLDSFRMAEASQVSIAVDSKAVPVADPGRRMECLTWGDDYQLLFTLPDGVAPAVTATCIGKVEPRGFAPLFVDGEPVTNAKGLGYLHD